MLKQYRRQFIVLNMCLVGVVLLVMLVLVDVYMYHDYYGNLKNTMSEVVKPLSPPSVQSKPLPDKEPKTDSKTPPRKKGNASKNEKPSPVSAKERKNINTVFYTQSTGDISILSEELVFEESVIAEAVSVIVNQSEDFGTLSEYNMIYYRSGSGGAYKIAVASKSYLRESMVRLSLILIGIFGVSMFLFFLISYKISLLAVKPLEETMAREKQFVADASHDLKTPLTVILANSSILQSNPQSTVSEQIKWIDSTAAAARNMQAMVDSLLTLSRVEAADTAVEMERVNFSDMAEKAVLQMESVAYDMGIKLSSEIKEDVYIHGNSAYLLHIISSLIENALKYESENGSVSVGLDVKKGFAVLTVANENSIIAPEDLPHIFERFYRADKTRNASSGHGLGLAITKRMTEAMGGTITVESSMREGTKFFVRFKII